MTFDATINLGNLVAVLGTVLGGLIAYTKLMSRLAVMEHKLDVLWHRFLRVTGGSEEEAST